MDIKATVKKTATLSRLEFSDAELDKFASQFEEILQYVAQIEELDLEDIEPLSHVLTLENVMRDDTPVPPLDIKDALRNAPKHNDNFFKVPKVIE